VEHARHLLAQRRFENAADLAQAAFDRATAGGYDGLAARAAATAGRCEASPSVRADWYRRALSLLLRTRDRSVAFDLFALEDPRDSDLVVTPDECFDDVLYDALVGAIPHLRVQDTRQEKAARRFVRSLTYWILGAETPSAALDESIRAVECGAPSFTPYVVHFGDDASDVLQTFFLAVAPLHRRAATGHRLSGATHRMAFLVRPSADPRRFLVG
jgi:hypothetical protein